MVQPLASFERQIAPGKKSLQHRPNPRGTGRPGRNQREGTGRTEQRAIALRGSAQARSERRTREGKPGRGKEKNRAFEAESQKAADASPAVPKGQKTGQERPATKRPATKRPATKRPATKR